MKKLFATCMLALTFATCSVVLSHADTAKPACTKPTPTPTPTPTPVPTPVTGTISSSVNNTNNNSSNSSSNSNSNSTSTSSSNQSQNQGQSQTANGGNSSSSSTATGGNSSSSSQGGNANASNGGQANEQVTNQNQVRQAPSISAPAIISTGPCAGSSMSGGASGPVGGVSFGRNKVDQGCDTRMDANEMFGIGSKLAGCKLLIQEKKFQKAGVTLEDCMGPKPLPAPEPVAPVTQVVPPPPPPVISVTVPVTVVEPSLPTTPIVNPQLTKPPVRKPVRHMQPACQNGMELRCVIKQPLNEK
jgi:hypothetical protein